MEFPFKILIKDEHWYIPTFHMEGQSSAFGKAMPSSPTLATPLYQLSLSFQRNNTFYFDNFILCPTPRPNKRDLSGMEFNSLGRYERGSFDTLGPLSSLSGDRLSFCLFITSIFFNITLHKKGKKSCSSQF